MVLSYTEFRQRLRGPEFGDDDAFPAGEQPAFPRTQTMIRKKDEPLLLPPQTPEAGEGVRPTVVFDLDETLIYTRTGPLYARPYFRKLLAFTCLFFETVVWTAGQRDYAEAVMEALDPAGNVDHIIYRHPKWYTENGPKDLSLLGRNLKHVIMIENNPYSVVGNEANSVLVEDYIGPVPDNDPTLHALEQLLRGLIDSQLPVPQYLAQSPLLVSKPGKAPPSSPRAMTPTTAQMETAKTNPKVYYINPTKVEASKAEWDVGSLIRYVGHSMSENLWSSTDENECEVKDYRNDDKATKRHLPMAKPNKGSKKPKVVGVVHHQKPKGHVQKPQQAQRRGPSNKSQKPNRAKPLASSPGQKKNKRSNPNKKPGASKGWASRVGLSRPKLQVPQWLTTPIKALPLTTSMMMGGLYEAVVAAVGVRLLWTPASSSVPHLTNGGSKSVSRASSAAAKSLGWLVSSVWNRRK